MAFFIYAVIFLLGWIFGVVYAIVLDEDGDDE